MRYYLTCSHNRDFAYHRPADNRYGSYGSVIEKNAKKLLTLVVQHNLKRSAMSYEGIDLIDNKSVHHFELWSNGEHAFIDYTRKNDTVFLIHTEVPESLQGTGMAEAIVRKTLIYLESQHQKIVPYCVYIKAFLKRHPEWNRLLAV